MKNTHLKLLTLIVLSVFLGCKETPKNAEDKDRMANEAMSANATVPTAWITNRVAKSKARLNGTDAGKVVWNAMEAHGGLAIWYGNGPLSFRFNYQPLDTTKAQRDSYQTVDTWSNKARHTSATDSTAHYGWSGTTAWVKAADSLAFKYDTKFWALTPIYFLGQPFILDGEGVNLELLPQKTYKRSPQDVVKVTFDAGTGDAPDDYYILYFKEDTHQLTAIRYIVSYPAYFKDGGHLPEKFMEVIGATTVEGILFPTGYKTHWLTDEETPGEYITKIDVSDIHFEEQVSKDFFDVPEGAKIVE
ncbi:hypothetical protein BFP77_05355 [Maribacter sp. 4U21]|uniref:hypothetical protein n=1 Tax=Maribacter sp. 4U21 TaxID=1889779 RepID=UPI000C14E633|nr:hypothetical protein [Maribacter sp. 4U21]PIB29582.1 hypothetical protein BFP77_05355 [Maribacter sp. 4U21]